MNTIIENWAKDFADDLVYKYPRMWAEIDLPSYVLLDTDEVQDQKADWYKMWCVNYSISEASNYLNLKNTNGWDLCDISTTRDDVYWDYVINWAKLAKKEWIIKAYFQVDSLYEIKLSLFEKNPVHSWSNKIDRSTIINSPYVASWTGWPWHSFHIIGFDDSEEHLICKNSWWEKRYDQGKFYISYDKYNKLLFHTRLSIIETEDSLIALRKKIMEEITLESAKHFVERGYSNWERPSDNITRQELWATIERVLKNNWLK